MDSKEIKAIIKQAREAIREKEYKTALKYCKAILKLDKQNYNAWIFIGVSAQEIEQPVQAEAAFRKAIEISPNHYLAWQGLCQFYEKNNGEENKEKLIEIYIKIIELMKDEKSKQLEIIKKLWDIYIQLDQQKKENEYEKIVSVFKKYIENFSDSDQISEYYCHIAIEIFTEREIILEGTFEIANSLHLKTGSHVASLALGMVAASKRCYLDAIELYKLSVNADEKCISGYLLLTKTFLKIYKYSEAKSAALAGLKLGTSKSSNAANIRNVLYLYVAEALAGQHMWKQAFQFLDKAIEKLGRTTKCLELLCKIYLKMNEIDKVKEICTELKANGCMQTLQIEAIVHLIENDYQEAEHKIQKAVILKSEGLSLHLLGVLYWNMLRTKESFDYFIKATKEDPYFSRNFLYLGHYYLKNDHDFINALKCYKKAFELDVYDEEVGIALSDILKEMKENEANLQVLQKVIKQSAVGSAKWARFRLGLYYLHEENASLAIDALQGALHCNLTDSHCWETIGEAYLLRGSYSSALKSFEKAVKLNPSNLHSHYCVAQILLLTGVYADAIIEFEKILKIEPSYIAAFKGLAESLLSQAQYYLSESLFGRFKDCCQNAICILVRAVNHQSRFSCLWKLLGDALTLPNVLDPEYFPFSLPGELLNKKLETMQLGKAEMLVLGGKFYGQALAIHPEISNLWHDLGINYYYQSKFFDKNKKLAEKSLLCVEKAICMNPSISKYWNTLGIIATDNELKNYSLSQHSFIKSIDCENDNTVAWTNLGVLYLFHDEVQLAHKAFSAAQKSDPSYSVCWIGQALVAEAVKHDQTTDLFRHATTIGNHPEGLLGYGHWVCKALKEKMNHNSRWYKENIIDMNAVAVALDCLIKYTENNRNCSIAYNMMGLLLEREGLFRESLISLERSVELQKKMKFDLQDILVNCARLCIINKKPEEALKYFSKIDKYDDFSLCSLALAYYCTGNYNKCDKAYIQTEKLTSSKEIKLSILAARSVVIKQVQGLKEMKLFLENFQIDYSFEVLQMLCAVALLQNDINLAKTTLDKLEQYKNNPKYLFSISFLNSCFYIFQEKKEDAKRQLCKTILKLPNNFHAWIHLAFILYHKFDNFSLSLKVMRIVSQLHTAALNSPLISLCHLASGNIKSALRESEKLLHLHPDVPLNWLLFLSCCSTARIPNISTLFSFARNFVQKNKYPMKMFTYLCLQEVIYHMSINNLSDANLILNMLMQIDIKDSYTSSVIKFISTLYNTIGHPTTINSQLLKELNNQCQQIPKFAWGILEIVKLYLKLRKANEAIEMLQELLLHEEISSHSRLMLYIQLSVIAYRMLQENPRLQDYLSLCHQNIETALKLSPSCQILHFLQAMLAEKKGNSRLHRRSLERVLENKSNEEELRIEDISKKVLQQIYKMKEDKEAFLEYS